MVLEDGLKCLNEYIMRLEEPWRVGIGAAAVALAITLSGKTGSHNMINFAWGDESESKTAVAPTWATGARC